MEAGALSYDEAIILDAEDLAEQGMQAAYAELLPRLKKWGVSEPASLEEIIENDATDYRVRCNGKEYRIYTAGGESPGESSWGNATFAFFDLVNGQLAGSRVKLYALNGGNDLKGIFLTPEQATAARASLPNAGDWPYLPTNEPPWFGAPH